MDEPSGASVAGHGRIMSFLSYDVTVIERGHVVCLLSPVTTS